MREEFARDAATQRSLWYYCNTRPELDQADPKEERPDEKKLAGINSNIDKLTEEIWGLSGDSDDE